jgi:integrase/recombinase XerD
VRAAMTLNESKEWYLEKLKTKGFAKSTLKLRSFYFDKFFLFLERQHVRRVQDITKTQVYAYALKIWRSPYAASSKESILWAIKIFLQSLYDEQLIFEDLAARIPEIKRSKPLKKTLTQVQVHEFLSLPDIGTMKGIRDKAMLELLYSTGIRRSELTGLNLYDVNFRQNELRVIGKGDKERVLPIGKIASRWMQKYLNDVRPHYVKSEREEAFFITLEHGRRFSPTSISILIDRYKAGLSTRKKISAHIFRHSSATHMIQNGASVLHIQKFLGHASPHTTEVYTHLDVKNLRAMIKKCHPREKASFLVSQTLERTAVIQKKSAGART